MCGFQRISNLIVQVCFDVVSGALDKIRDSVKYVKGSLSRANMFQNCTKTVGIQIEIDLI